jgi:hypothetical protein
MKTAEASENKHPEARRHHYVPSCWLAGFTQKGVKDDQLFVTDLLRKKQWPSTPENAGHQRDFYRLKGKCADPLAVEKFFSRLEASIAPLLRFIDRNRPEILTHDELDCLLHFMAFQFVRLPTFRPLARRVFDTAGKERLAEALRDPATWTQALIKIGKDPNAHHRDYERSKAFFDRGDWDENETPDWYLESGFGSVDQLLNRLRERHWRLITTHNGRLVASDNPILLYGSNSEKVGFRNAELIGYPISRHVFITGTLSRTQRPIENLKLFAELNTLTMLRADAQVYSNAPNFIWQDTNKRILDDWTQFNRI